MTASSLIPPADSDNLKRCPQCGEYKLATTAYFHRNKRTKSGLSCWCISCRSANSRAFYAANLEKEHARNKAYRADNPEKERKRHKEYQAANQDKLRAYYEANVDKFRTDARERWWANRDIRIEQNLKWREANKDRQAEYKREYYQAHKEEVREYKRRWSEVNKERKRDSYRKWVAVNRNKLRIYQHAWRKANRDKVSVYASARRARSRSLEAVFTQADWQSALDHFGGCCAACGRQAGLWHIIASDHWIPLSAPDCPGSVPWNIVPLCHATRDGEGGCNNSKKDRPAKVWLTEQFGERKGRAIQQRIEAYLHAQQKAPA